MSGQTIYAYVGGNPVSRKDPKGLEYYTQDFPMDQPPVVPLCASDDCVCNCISESFGLTATAVGIDAATLPLNPKPFAPPNAGDSTSLASQAARDLTGGARMNRQRWAPTWNNPASRTASVGGFAARWLGWFGMGLTAYDLFKIHKCIDRCKDGQCDK